MSRPVGGSQNRLLNGLLRPLLLLLRLLRLLLLLALRLLLLLLSLRLLLLLLLWSARGAARRNVPAADLWPPLLRWRLCRGRGPLHIASLRRAARVLRERLCRSDHDRCESSACNKSGELSCSHTPVPR